MKYKPSEIAKEIGCNVRKIYRTCIPADCPHEIQENGRYWIVGDLFRDWMLMKQREAIATRGSKLGEGQGYCVVCEKAVDLRDIFEIKPVNISLELVKGYCSECGAVVSKGRERKSQ